MTLIDIWRLFRWPAQQSHDLLAIAKFLIDTNLSHPLLVRSNRKDMAQRRTRRKNHWRTEDCFNGQGQNCPQQLELWHFILFSRQIKYDDDDVGRGTCRPHLHQLGILWTLKAPPLGSRAAGVLAVFLRSIYSRRPLKELQEI